MCWCAHCLTIRIYWGWSFFGNNFITSDFSLSYPRAVRAQFLRFLSIDFHIKNKTKINERNSWANCCVCVFFHFKLCLWTPYFTFRQSHSITVEWYLKHELIKWFFIETIMRVIFATLNIDQQTEKSARRTVLFVISQNRFHCVKSLISNSQQNKK